MRSGNGFGRAASQKVEEAAASLFEADVQALCQAGAHPLENTGNRAYLDHLLATLGAALPALSDAITNTWFSHAEMERYT